VMPHANVRLCPRSNGDGRFRASVAVNSAMTVAYSPVRWVQQTFSVRSMISANRSLTVWGRCDVAWYAYLRAA
jgi:hypothetical protein